MDLAARIPRPYDEYFALFTLGSAGTADYYFPMNRSNIVVTSPMSWSVGVHNHMGTAKFVKIVFKLLNLTMAGPDQVKNTPSERLGFYEKTRLLTLNETWVFPVSWSILNATKSESGTTIGTVLFNGEILSENVMVFAGRGLRFRMVIELWTYDEVIGGFEFQWTANGVTRVAWNQIWFDMTLEDHLG